MDKMKTVHIFDFDGTLVDSPLPQEGKVMFTRITGRAYPYQGWWGREESLLPEYDIKPIPLVHEAYTEAKINGDAVVLLTNRMSKLERHVVHVTNSLGMVFDQYSFKYDHRTKSDRARDIIVRHFPEVDIVHVWEDMDEHVLDFRSLETKLRALDDTKIIEVVIHKVPFRG